ncbi:RE1-silencing transcription factor [Takifugu flavidus]|uniref:RE1-silencing transcription factor n=1 Tax=Takifugu flavidus TaxID=433684 RepID=A0A5C6MLH7_9TELE|nr:RE1-silencing transcription factor [Takifugu flavidus]TWW55505.1 RE1-silencing transcription factor [Takifugu flavidus]
MAAQTMFSAGPLGMSLMDNSPTLCDLHENAPPPPQLVMLANVAAVTAADGDGGALDEKEMMELKTVGSSYLDSDEDNGSRYTDDNQNCKEFCVIEYPESPDPTVQVNPVVTGSGEDDRNKAETPPAGARPRPLASTKPSEQDGKVNEGPGGTKKKKPFYCKPCHFQAQNEQQFVEHLRTHSASKMMVVNHVEGRSRNKTRDADAAASGEAENSGGDTGDSKGLIRCERCGYNTNRFDHYIAHLKHHSKEGDDHRVFKCTLCPYTTVSQYHWRKHLRNHFPSKLHTCSQCSYFSDRKSNYIQHIRTHTGVRPFQCLYCDYSSSQKTHLTRHMRTHSGERPFKCESCNYLAANQHEVTRHARQVHNGPKPLSCPYCDYKTADRSNYKKHVELHLNPRQFLCPVCKYAASKKCNLQYHIKSRHAGCNVAMDISKVKLRVKKAGPNGAEENSSVHKRSDTREDFEVDRDNRDKGTDANPINLSIRRSSRPGNSQSAQTEAPDKVQDKTSRSEREKFGKVKEQEKRITTRQKVKRAHEKVPEEEIHPGSTTATKIGDGKAKTKVRKLQAEEQNPTEPNQTLKPDQRQSEDKRKMRPDKDKENQSSRKKKKGLNKSRKSGSQHSEKCSRHADDSQQNLSGSQQTPEKKVAKEKAPKRRSAEAPGPTKSLCDMPPKTRRTKGAEKLHPIPEGPGKIGDTRSTFTTKQKRSRNVSVNEDNLAVNKISGGPAQPQGSTENPDTEPNSSATKEDSPGALGLDPRGAQDAPPNPTEPQLSSDSSLTRVCVTDPQNTVEKVPDPSRLPPPEPPPHRPSRPAAPAEPAQPVNGPAEVADGRLDEDASLMFSHPTSPPTLVLPVDLAKPADPEDDEGIHSSHEGGSDISDSASEGSEDSGLNSNGGSGKLANDPETPTAELPTPTELKGHMCIFCDRCFPLEAAYRRHLNRHLVNVYYMDTAAGAQT